MKKLLDKDIRKAMLPLLREQYPDRRIVEEMNCFGTRIDVAVLSPDEYIGIEIKSDGDTLKLLDKQIDEYSNLCDYRVVVMTSNILKSLGCEGMKKLFNERQVAIVTADINLAGDMVVFRYLCAIGRVGSMWQTWNGAVHENRKIKKKNIKNIIGYLWKGELKEIIEKYQPGAMKNKSAFYKEDLVDVAYELLTEKQARYELMCRVQNKIENSTKREFGYSIKK